MDLVSVIIPTYNRPIFLKRTIDSILKQTYKNIEVIVVDDNNPYTNAREETEELISDYLQFKNIKYIQHKRNKNGSAARNTGIKNSKGKYLIFFDDDDTMNQYNIEKKYNVLKNSDEKIGFVYSGYNKFKGKRLLYSVFSNKKGNLTYHILNTTLQLGSGSNSMFKREVVNKIGFFDESLKRHQDWDYLLRSFERFDIEYINEALINIYVDDRQNIPEIKIYEEQKKTFLSKFEYLIKGFDYKKQKYIYDAHYFQLLILSLKRKNLKNILRFINKISFINLFQLLYFKVVNKK